jgi:hypothetical protein
LDEDRLARANSVYSSTRQALGALAESAAGVLIALVGAVALFAADAVTFAVGAVVYAALRVPSVEVERFVDESDDRVEAEEGDGESDDGIEAEEGDDESDGRAGLTLSGYAADIREGVATIRESPLRYAVAGAMLANVGTGLATAVLPAFGDAVGGPGAYGLLLAATTAGTLVGSAIAARFEDRPLGSVVVGGFLVAGVGRVAAVVVETPAVVFVAFGVAAVPLGVYNVLVSTVMQVGVPNRLMARVSSTNGTLLAVVGPLGLVVGGALGTLLDAATVVGLSAGGYLLLAAWWLVVPTLRSFPAPSSLEPGAFDPAE